MKVHSLRIGQKLELVVEIRKEAVWTTTPPTEDGWYWHKELDQTDKQAEVLHVWTMSNGNHKVVRGGKSYPQTTIMEMFGGSWQGPITRKQ